MDSDLQQLAKTNRATYTRYADDITFSTTRAFPRDLAYRDDLKQIHIGYALNDVIERNGFQINRNKVTLRARNQRQAVTNITVNDITNVPKQFRNRIRAMLYVRKTHGLPAAQKTWEEKNSSKTRGPQKSIPRFEQIVKGNIEYLGMVRGQTSRTYLKFMDELAELAPELARGRGTPMRILLRKFDELNNKSESAQARGLDFEALLNELFDLSDITVIQSFRRSAGGEQIDGAFELHGSYYLMECKWRSRLTDQSQVDAFSGKVGRSGNDTGGLFVTINGWTDHVLSLTKRNRSKNVFLMNGDDVRAVLEERISLVDLLTDKIRALNIRAEPYVGAHEILRGRSIKQQ